MKLLKYFISIVTTGFLLSTPALHAQDVVIRGTVISSTDNLPIIGASVVELDKDNRYITGGVTDVNGNYALKVKSLTNKISFANISFKTVVEDINGRNRIDKTLEEDVHVLSTIEIVGKSTKNNNGFMNVDEKESVTSIKKINTKELEDIPAASIDDALQGRIAGVDIVASSGDPGSGMTIKIRGMSSLTGNTDPLIVVDGVPMDTRVNNAFNLSSATQENFAQLLTIAPDDIKDISVLVDAASTAVYGSQGSNGVILIATKRGAPGKVQVNYSLRSTYSKQPAHLPLLSGDEYLTLIPEGYLNAFKSPLPVSSTTNVEFLNDPTVPMYYNYNKNTDWLGEITRMGKINDHSISFTGGGEKARYRASVNYYDQVGTTVGTDMKRITTSLNVDYMVSDKINFSADMRYSHIENNRSYVFNDNATSTQVREVAFRKMPNMSVYQYDEYGNITPNYFAPQSNSQGTFPTTYNPVALAREGKNKVVTENVIPTFRVGYKVAKWINYDLALSFTIDNSTYNKFLPQVASGQDWTQAYLNDASDEDRQSYNVYSKNGLTFSPDLGSLHKLTAYAGFTTNTGDGYSYKVASSNLPSSNLSDPLVSSRLNSTTASLSSTKTKYRTFSGILSANYTFKERYTINGTLRSDADPKFGEKYTYGTFLAFGGRWNINEEEFLKNSEIISDLSLRGNYGVNGNQSINPTTSRFSIYNSSGYEYAGTTGIYASNIELQNFRWEKKTQRNVGISVGFLKSKFLIDFNVFNDKISDGFVPRLSIPTSSGYSVVDMNMLSATNQGFDLDLKATILRKGKTSLDFRFNCGTSQMIIKNISSKYNVDIDPQTPSNGAFILFPRDNAPLGSIYGLKYKGVYKDLNATIATDDNGNQIRTANGIPIYMKYNHPQSNYIFQPGDAKYEDVNKDGNINYNDVAYLGSSNPTLTGGFGSNFKYNGFYIDAYFNFRYNYVIVNQTKMLTENMYTFDNQSTATLRRWRNPGDETDIPRASIGAGYNWIGSDRFVEDGSFLRMKTLTFGYSFDPKMLEKIKLKDFKLYVTMTNLLTFTNYSGQDPEVNVDSSNTDNQIIVDNGRTPRTKDITVGISIGF